MWLEIGVVFFYWSGKLEIWVVVGCWFVFGCVGGGYME